MQNPMVRAAAMALMGLSVALFFQACCGGCGLSKTPLAEDKLAFVGHWTGDKGTTLTIGADGSGSLEMTGGAANKSVSGGAVTFVGDKMTIGLFGIEEEFTIDEAPKEGGSEMVLSGEKFKK